MIRYNAATILFVATIAAAALTQATYVRAATKYDGAWSIVIVTRAGPCNAAYRFSGKSGMELSITAAAVRSISTDASGPAGPPGSGFRAARIMPWGTDG